MPKLSDNGAVLLPVPPAFATALAKPSKKPSNPCPSYSNEALMSTAAEASAGQFSVNSSFAVDAKANWLD